MSLPPRTAYESRQKEDRIVPEGTNGANVGSGTVAGLLAFLDWVVKKNYATPAAITPLKSAAKQVFTTVEDGEIDDVDVRSLDRDEYFSRFQVAMQASGRLTPESIRAYRARFTRALELYDDYLTTGGTPKIKSRSAAAPSRPRKEKAGSPAAPAPVPVTPEAAPETTTNMISYPFPLEGGDVANLRLPKRLERRDADRLIAFINALSFEPQKQLGRGPGHPETAV